MKLFACKNAEEYPKIIDTKTPLAYINCSFPPARCGVDYLQNKPSSIST